LRALKTVEILEDILLWHFALDHAKALAIPSDSDSQRARALPQRRLLQLHRVSKHWRAVIKGSTSLSRLLFTKPLASGPTDHSHYDADDTITPRKRRRHYVGLRGAEADAHAGNSNGSASFEVNPLLLDHSDDRFSEHGIVHSSQADGGACTFHSFWAELSLLVAVAGAREMSARKTFLTQPPAVQVRVAPSWDFPYFHVVRRDKGVTMWDVADTVKKIWAKDERRVEKRMSGDERGGIAETELRVRIMLG